VSVEISDIQDMHCNSTSAGISDMQYNSTSVQISDGFPRKRNPDKEQIKMI